MNRIFYLLILVIPLSSNQVTSDVNDTGLGVMHGYGVGISPNSLLLSKKDKEREKVAKLKADSKNTNIKDKNQSKEMNLYLVEPPAITGQ
jgi:hypothetical protein